MISIELKLFILILLLSFLFLVDCVFTCIQTSASAGEVQQYWDLVYKTLKSVAIKDLCRAKAYMHYDKRLMRKTRDIQSRIDLGIIQ
jgi:hypothetical protein